MKKYLWTDRSQVLLSCVIFIVIWEVLALKIDNPIYLPTIESVISNILEIVRDKDFIYNLLSSIFRTMISFIIALILALILGILASMNNTFKNFIKPITALSISIPTMILVVLALIWFDKDKAPFVVGIFIVFPILYEGVISSILSIDSNLVEMSDVYKINKLDRFRYIYIPSIKFNILDILVSTLSLAFKVVIAGEIHGQPKYGVGTVVQYEKMNFNTEAIFAWIIIIAIISLILDIYQKNLSKRVFKWRT